VSLDLHVFSYKPLLMDYKKKKYSYRFVSFKVSAHHRHQLQETEKLTVLYRIPQAPPVSQPESFP